MVSTHLGFLRLKGSFIRCKFTVDSIELETDYITQGDVDGDDIWIYSSDPSNRGKGFG